jgi:hypothetical protein
VADWLRLLSEVDEGPRADRIKHHMVASFSIDALMAARPSTLQSHPRRFWALLRLIVFHHPMGPERLLGELSSPVQEERTWAAQAFDMAPPTPHWETPERDALIADALCAQCDPQIFTPQMALLARGVGRRIATQPARAFLEKVMDRLTGPGRPELCHPIAIAGELRHPDLVPALIEHLDARFPDVTSAAHKALITTTALDLGSRPKRWLRFWKTAQLQDRTDWLFEHLTHDDLDVRVRARHELARLTGPPLGYHYDLPRAERKRTAKRWQAEWQRKLEDSPSRNVPPQSSQDAASNTESGRDDARAL